MYTLSLCEWAYSYIKKIWLERYLGPLRQIIALFMR